MGQHTRIVTFRITYAIKVVDTRARREIDDEAGGSLGFHLVPYDACQLQHLFGCRTRHVVVVQTVDLISTEGHPLAKMLTWQVFASLLSIPLCPSQCLSSSSTEP